MARRCPYRRRSPSYDNADYDSSGSASNAETDQIYWIDAAAFFNQGQEPDAVYMESRVDDISEMNDTDDAISFYSSNKSDDDYYYNIKVLLNRVELR